LKLNLYFLRSDYLVLEKANLGYADDIKKFSYAIEVLGVINTIHQTNKLKKDLNNNGCVDPDIFYKIIEAIFTEKPFTNTQLIEYYDVLKKLQTVSHILVKFKEIVIYIPIEVERFLLGLSFEKQRNLKDFQIQLLDEKIEAITYKKELGIIDSKEFVKKAKNIITEIQLVNIKNDTVIN